jgi:hypothetical protein
MNYKKLKIELNILQFYYKLFIFYIDLKMIL